MKRVGEFFELLKKAAVQWSEDQVPQQGAALAYYSLFSLAPLFLIAIAIAGAIFGEQAAQGEVVAQLRGIVGPATAKSIEELILHSRSHGNNAWAVIASGIGVLIGASFVFSQLQASLNLIWKVKARPGHGWWGWIRDYLASFAMVFATGILLLVSLVLTTCLTAVGRLMPVGAVGDNVIWWRILNDVFFTLITGLLFAVIYRRLPDVNIAWKDVWVGAAFTAVLFTIGKYLIGQYVAYSGVASPYGAAGSMVLLLVWVYYSALIVLFGAEFTRAWAEKNGTPQSPSHNSIPNNSCDSVGTGAARTV